MDIVEWMGKDEGQKFFSDLVVDIASDVFQTVISCVCGAVATMIIGGMFSSVIVVAGSGLIVGIGVGILLTYLDDRFKLTEQAQEKVRQCDQAFSDLVGDIFVKPFCNFLYRLEQEAAAAQGFSIP